MTILEKRLNEFKKRQDTLKGNYTSQIINLERRIREENELIEKINKTKKSKLLVLGIALLILWVLSGAIYFIFADNRTEQEKQLDEISDYIANMSDQEYYETFFKEEDK